METHLEQNELKILIKSALAEVLREERGLLSEVMEDALEDFVLTRAIAEGIKTPKISREEVFSILEENK